MLIVEYDPIKGKVVPDGEVRKWADNVIEMHERNKGLHTTAGSVIMIDAIRVLVMKGKLAGEKIIFRFEGKDLEVERGYLKHWPKGFCDTYDEILEDLLGWNKEV